MVVGVGVGVGGGESERTEKQSQGYGVTLGWRRSDLELRLGALVSEAAPYESLQEMWKNSSPLGQLRLVSAAQREGLLHLPPCGGHTGSTATSDANARSFISDNILMFHFLWCICFTVILPFLFFFLQLIVSQKKINFFMNFHKPYNYYYLRLI